MSIYNILGIMSYYDVETNDKPRGSLDLATAKLELTVDPSLEGSPTKYTLLLTLSKTESWKLCAATKEDQQRWVKIILKYADLKQGPISPMAESIQVDPSKSNQNDNLSNNNTHLSIANASDVSNKIGNSQNNSTKPIAIPKRLGKPKLVVGKQVEIISSDTLEIILVVIIFNSCLAMVMISQMYALTVSYYVIANFVVVQTLYLRGQRFLSQEKLISTLNDQVSDYKLLAIECKSDSVKLNEEVVKPIISDAVSSTVIVSNGKPKAGGSFPQVDTPPLKSPDHTWCKCDHRLFNVRIGPNYSRFKKKAPSAAPIFDVFAVDVFWLVLKALFELISLANILILT